MESLKIVTGEKRICINDDPTRILVFNPTDVLFVEKFYRLLTNFQGKVSEYEKISEQVESHTELDDQGIPLNVQERMDLLKEACQYSRDQIDKLFGTGTSQMVFGDVLELDVFIQFFDGLTPFIQQARTDRVNQYVGKRSVG